MILDDLVKYNYDGELKLNSIVNTTYLSTLFGMNTNNLILSSTYRVKNGLENKWIYNKKKIITNKTSIPLKYQTFTFSDMMWSVPEWIAFLGKGDNITGR